MQDYDSGFGSSPPNTTRPVPDIPASLDLSSWPPIYLSTTHFDTEDLNEFEEELDHAKAILTYDIREAAIILSKATKKLRIRLDLRAKGLPTVEARSDGQAPENAAAKSVTGRKRKIDHTESSQTQSSTIVTIDDSTASEGEDKNRATPNSRPVDTRKANSGHVTTRIVKVLRTDWFTDSQKLGHPQSIEKYITYCGHVINSTEQNDRVPAASQKLPDRGAVTKLTATSQHAVANKSTKPTPGSAILQRAQEEAPSSTGKHDRFGSRKYHYPNTKTPSANPASWEAGHGTQAQYAHLLQQTTTDYEGGVSSDVPEPPDWVKRGVKYACQRLTPKDNPNDAFVQLLEKIKMSRLLTADEIGVRAYATSIASLKAYTYEIVHTKEIIRLPGCDNKIANLWVEWKNTGGKIKAVEDLEADEDLKILKLFYNIWGVGQKTAREFYYDRGWRELDDIVEFGWDTLERVQQIGVKYYDEFEDPIPRAEVESISKVIHDHAVKARDDGIQSIIVGGYRRGKEACGDVDIVLSHPDEAATHNIIEDIVASLEEEGWITHTLTLSLNNSKRGQQTLPFRAEGGGHGFDTLDKALVVWQDPHWPTREQDLAANPKAKNPNIHRRVDIIISPWRTVGCAVVGWSGGTTFERDLRRYAKNVKGWKFDSSGVRNRGNGEVVDLEGHYRYGKKEGVEGRAKTMLEAERRVFEGFGLTWREPWERCTG